MSTAQQLHVEELLARADILVADIEHHCRSGDARALRDARRMAGELRRVADEIAALLDA